VLLPDAAAVAAAVAVAAGCGPTPDRVGVGPGGKGYCLLLLLLGLWVCPAAHITHINMILLYRLLDTKHITTRLVDSGSALPAVKQHMSKEGGGALQPSCLFCCVLFSDATVTEA
jgi:hypothetical protein